MGRPTSRSENSIALTFVRQVTEAFAQSFLEVNAITDPEERRHAFADRIAQLASLYDSSRGRF